MFNKRGFNYVVELFFELGFCEDVCDADDDLVATVRHEFDVFKPSNKCSVGHRRFDIVKYVVP